MLTATQLRSGKRIFGKRPNDPRYKMYEFKGERRTILGWCEKYGLNYACVQSRLRQGTPLDAPKQARGRPK